ncbi:hypothetical protein [Micromonospora sp. DT229]|uniref:hypothetical protein n=1 Tax=Micromonospora sp. DT229 TaxID=3393430 RepID=UPI003CED45C5
MAVRQMENWSIGLLPHDAAYRLPSEHFRLVEVVEPPVHRQAFRPSQLLASDV